MGQTHRNTKLHFIWPCGILTKWPRKEYEQRVWEEDHECRRKLFLLIFIGSTIHNMRTKFMKSVVVLAVRSRLPLELRRLALISFCLLIFEFQACFWCPNDKTGQNQGNYIFYMNKKTIIFRNILHQCLRIYTGSFLYYITSFVHNATLLQQ